MIRHQVTNCVTFSSLAELRDSERIRILRRSVLYTLSLCILSLSAADAAFVNVSLTGDDINSDPGLLTGTHTANLVSYTLTDQFVYNPNDVTSSAPHQGLFLEGMGGAPALGRLYHGAAPSGGVANLFYNLAGPLLPEIFVIDIWGRTDNCCKTRDDNFDVNLRSGGFNGSIVASQTGLGLPDDDRVYLRVTFVSPAAFDAIEIAGHHANFTLAEVRAAELVVPEPTAPIVLITWCTLGCLRFRRYQLS